MVSDHCPSSDRKTDSVVQLLIRWMTTRQYMDHYAREEYRHGLSRNSEFAILIRALDHPWSHPEGFSPFDAAPVTWVGYNRHTLGYEDRGIQAHST